MASVKQEAEKDRKLMAANIVATGADADEPDDDKPSGNKPSGKVPAKSTPASHHGFFTIYKKGQGKWTRLGTLFTAALLGLLTSYNIYNRYLAPYVPATDSSKPETIIHARHISMLFLGISVAFFIVFNFFVYWLTNRPQNADFLIATDSEMKKVNWTTKGELYGSTRVVVGFIIFIGIFLFCCDLLFGWFFHLVKVLY